MDALIRTAPPLQGSLTMPPDKSVCHRAAVIAAVAEGETTIRPWPESDDCQETLQVLRALGVFVQQSGDRVSIHGIGPRSIQAPAHPLCCGESGTTLRLAAGLIAGYPVTATLTAGRSLSRRPMRRIAEPLAQMGADVAGTSGVAGLPELYPPLTIRGRRPLRPIRYEMPVPSAQVKSAILLAGLSADGCTTVVEPVETRDHTERALRHFGADLRRDGGELALNPTRLRSPGTMELPGDFSSAAFLLVAATCVPSSRLTLLEVGLNPTRIRALEILKRMGASVQAVVSGQGWEPRGALTVEARPLRGTVLEAHEVPGVIDELPILMVAAACAEGLTRMAGLGELRVKETDRIQSMVRGLRALGASIRLAGADAVEIDGGRPLVGSAVESAGDHRTAMSLAVAGLAAGGTTRIRGAECVAKSFPDFFERLQRLTGRAAVTVVESGTG